ncbi:hypothetical protein BGW36DRAFT_466719 [Talaromyces proteolyticus]|uniref:HNH nuclease domain-containing protein n=1 Tax=Talaromyces proteolyticus TaxID=1131652 RepID=A0AAD4PTS6_9EURO|nr:uncharacterized protein BGW36DRAFT_466719 [Talaromyces proteolyticus]KAH8689179.1 hypothetical protein BGW36DRAFT_466719 [Talaromyces proteolyticus]
MEGEDIAQYSSAASAAPDSSAELASIVEEELDHPDRAQLIQHMSGLVGLADLPTARALLWLADIDILKALVEETPLTNLSRRVQCYGLLASSSVEKIPLTWLTRTLALKTIGDYLESSVATTSSMPVSAQTTPAGKKKGKKRSVGEMEVSDEAIKKRDEQKKLDCKKRDDEKCVLSKDTTMVVAHLYGFSLRKLQPSSFPGSLWSLLRCFWTEERVKSWEDAIFPNGAYQDACYNMLCLSPTAHAYLGKAYFALKPISISADKKELEVQFFWLAFNFESRSISIPVEVRPSLYVAERPRDSGLWNVRTGEPICSGDRIIMRTHNPDTHPLPDLRILEMQWFLQRACAIAGAAEPKDDDDDEDERDGLRALAGLYESDIESGSICYESEDTVEPIDDDMEFVREGYQVVQLEDENDEQTDDESARSGQESRSSAPSSVSTRSHKGILPTEQSISLDPVEEDSMDMEDSI